MKQPYLKIFDNWGGTEKFTASIMNMNQWQRMKDGGTEKFTQNDIFKIKKRAANETIKRIEKNMEELKSSLQKP